MKLAKARIYAKPCALKTDSEVVNNIIIHATSFFEYEDINGELDELLDDAKKKGIKLCPRCSMAMINNKCYMEKQYDKNNTKNN